jgi:ABC-type antimicrobial peptide transport system permease subunit
MQFFMTAGDNTFIERGTALEPEAADMLSLQMIAGDRKGLQDPNSILLSATTARKLYGNSDPIGKDLRLSNTYTVRVAGVYQDPPYNTDFKDISFVCPWQFFIHNWDWIRNLKDNWSSNCVAVLAQLNPNTDLDQLNRKIADTRARLYKEPGVKTGLFLYPMSRWHLYSEFNHGLEAGGLIVYIRMFSIIGIFVLLLACINFMNLSTARSERRAREVGIRKTMGSARSQLIFQFFTESILMSVLALFFALFFVFLALPGFNRIADKQLSIPSISPAFWLASIGFALFTGLIAGSYPAIYLSSFQPVKVLKGTFRAGRFATIPRKVLVVLQFSVSISLIIGTFVIFRQIGYARSRPVGYERTGLISIQERTTEIYKNYNAIHHDLLQKGLVVEMSESQCPVTDIWANEGGFQWTGKSPSLQASFAVVGVRHEFGKTLGWQFVQGRDFDKDLATDSTGLILNETAVRYMGLKDPVGMTIRWNKLNCKILGVVKDLVMASPYQPVPQTIFYILHEGGNIINIRLNPRLPIHEALAGTEAVFKKWDPSAPFDYHFTNEEYAKKFSYEIRIGTLASVFASLAILISCLGLFGLSSFLAEQRTREIGVRKVLGATIYNIWQLLSKDFVWLVAISLLIATPLAWYGMHAWLQQYAYRTELSWWIFAATGLAALLITLLTVSFQALRAALANPVRSLRTE